MARFLAWRMVQTLPVLFGVSVIAWGLVSLAPGDASRIYARQFAESGRPTDAEVELAREELGLDGGLVTQYRVWAGRALSGDLGKSFTTGAPVVNEMHRRVWPTVQLALGATLVMSVVGIPLGVVAALHRNRWPDTAARLVSLSSGALPSFFVALFLIWAFAAKLGWFPSLGRGGIEHLVLPSIALGMGGAGTFTRLVRASMLDVLSQDYVMAARAKGLREMRVVTRHAFRNAMIPVVTQMGLTVGALLGGAAIVEVIFSWPGVGKLAIDAIAARDYPVIQAVVLTSAIIYVLVNVAVDIAYRAIDPRIGGAT